jgi:arylsulfatase A-like enzyme
VLAEALASAFASLTTPVLTALRDLVLVVGLWAWPAGLAALGLAALLGELCGEDSPGTALSELWRDAARRSRALVVVLLAPLLLLWIFEWSRAAARFHNVELAALLVACASLGGFVLLALGGWWLQRAGTFGSGLGRLGGALVLASVGALGWVSWQTRGGFAQLDPRLLAAPVVGLLVLVACSASEWVRNAGRGFVLGVGAACFAAWVTLLSSAAPGPRLAMQGVWSRLLVGGLQRASDFDRDGYSQFLGGGDCAPFDGSINPGAREIAGDGVDNNCIAGDGGKQWQPQRPRWGASAHGAPTNLNVVVVTIEALRRDHVSFAGAAARDTTPNLAALARQSLVFERMYSAAPYTRLALASLFSSYAPSEIDWLEQAPEKRMRRIGPQTPWLPELLSSRGYDTAAVLTDFSAFTDRESVGFERGFRRYDTSTRLEYRGGTMWGFPASEQVDKAISYVEQAPRPFLLWLHLFEPHFRYEQPPGAPSFGTDDQARYDAEIWHADHELGRLLAALRRLELWDTTVLLVTGDHGEAFGEHGDRWHGSNLFDPQLRPAALLHVPGVPGKRIQQAVTFTDLAPTLARILGDRQSFDLLRGRSLTPLLHHAQLPPEDADAFVIENFAIEDGHAYQAALVKYPLKLVYVEQGRQFSLFDLSRDPAELEPLEPSLDARGPAMLTELGAYLERVRGR